MLSSLTAVSRLNKASVGLKKWIPASRPPYNAFNIKPDHYLDKVSFGTPKANFQSAEFQKIRAAILAKWGVGPTRKELVDFFGGGSLTDEQLRDTIKTNLSNQNPNQSKETLEKALDEIMAYPSPHPFDSPGTVLGSSSNHSLQSQASEEKTPAQKAKEAWASPSLGSQSSQQPR